MDIIPMLTALKGKVLDAAHFDILRHAYELQNETIAQLKTNNETFKESNALLKMRVATLEGEVKSLGNQLEAAVKALPAAPSEYTPQGIARRIMKLFQEPGNTELYENFLKQKLKCSDVEFSAAIRELKDKEMLTEPSYSRDHGSEYRLTHNGEQLVLRGLE